MDSKNNKPAIVVVAYNRLNSLKRLLESLKRGFYPEDTKLIISIDHSPDNSAVVDCAREFTWNAGEKVVISHPENLGLKRHIISCGDFSRQYGSVIILEDDLYVSPFFYQYTLQAIEFYENQDDISGIGLFNYTHIEKSDNPEPFNPAVDDADVYFIQYACSSGQAWSYKQWNAFRQWYDSNPDIKTIEGMPEHVLKWTERSWKKFFIAYLILQNRFFVFPRVSLTSNFDDVGTNRGLSTFEVQSILLLDDKTFSFKSLQDSDIIYDAHFEMLPEKIRTFNKKLNSYNFAVDLYGHKNPDTIKENFLLTTKKCKGYTHSFTRSLKPHEMNVIMDIQGSDIFLCRKNQLIPPDRKDKVFSFISKFNYYYRTTLSLSEIMIFVYFRIHRKLKKIKNRIFN